MSFHEVRLDDDLIIYETEGGPEFSTEIARRSSGAEKRNANWDEGLGSWDIGERNVLGTELDPIESFFRARKARLHPFRWKDWGDFEVTTTQGRLGLAAAGTGLPTHDLWKRYGDAAGTDDRRVWKPTVVTVYRNASPVTPGAGAGQVSIDLVNGQVTFVADATSAASGITAGATTQVVLAANPGTLVASQKLYLAGFGGADAALVNGIAHTINSVTGSGPYTFTLATNTAGKTLSVATGAGFKYPQAGDTLTWSGEFDKPVRFGVDKLRRRFIAKDGAHRLFYLDSLPVVELLRPE